MQERLRPIRRRRAHGIGRVMKTLLHSSFGRPQPFADRVRFDAKPIRVCGTVNVFFGFSLRSLVSVSM